MLSALIFKIFAKKRLLLFHGIIYIYIYIYSCTYINKQSIIYCFYKYIAISGVKMSKCITEVSNQKVSYEL